MRELTVDRREGNLLVCISGEDTVLVPCPEDFRPCRSTVPERPDAAPICPDKSRPEGCRILIFDEVSPERTPYVRVWAPLARHIDAIGTHVLLIAPNRSRQKSVRARFERIFKSPSSR